MTGIGRDPAGLEEILGPQPAAFHEVFGAGENPRVFFAPGRLNLIGEHVDYCGGPSLAVALDRGTYVLGRRTTGRELRLWAAREPSLERFDLNRLPECARGRWSDYVLGVLRELGPARLPGLELFVTGDLPVGVGLSSSASLTVAIALAVDHLAALGGGPSAWIAAALAAEREYVGVPCGILDPTAIVHAQPGFALWIDARDQTHEAVPVEWGRLALSVVESGVTRELATGGYAERVAECVAAFEVLRAAQPDAACLGDVTRATLSACEAPLGPTLLRRARHVISEVERTRAARATLERGHAEGLGPLLSASHASLRDDHEVSCPLLDRLVAGACRVDGVLGARLVGAGFGGAALVLHEESAAKNLRATLERGASHSSETLGLHAVRPGRGPGELA